MKNFQKIEDSIKLLSVSIGTSLELGKPTLLHSINVGINLLNYGYEDEIVIAGFLHDIFEDTRVERKTVISKFGEKVCFLIEANTKDKSIVDKKDRDLELMNRCAKNGKDAMIIKAVDLLENWGYFSKIDNEEKKERITYLGKMFLSVLPKNYKDEVFSKIRKVFTN